MVSAIWSYVISSKASKMHTSSPDHETISKDARLTIISRPALLFWPLVSCGCVVSALRYPLVVPRWGMVAGAVCGIVWVWYLIVAVRQIGMVNRREYELRRDELVSKSYRRGGRHRRYILTYRSKGGVWNTSTSRSRYENARQGDVVLAVFLPGGKKPLVHYPLCANTGDGSEHRGRFCVLT